MGQFQQKSAFAGPRCQAEQSQGSTDMQRNPVEAVSREAAASQQLWTGSMGLW